jgi:hypothetical protein
VTIRLRFSNPDWFRRDLAPVSRSVAGQAVDSGDRARIYANDFIGLHLEKVANGQTYSRVSAAAQADLKNTALANEVVVADCRLIAEAANERRSASRWPTTTRASGWARRSSARCCRSPRTMASRAWRPASGTTTSA